MANRQKTIYVCTECGGETSNWAGKCPSCGAWNTLQEIILERGVSGRGSASARAARSTSPRRLDELEITEEIRFSTGISEFDRVLGGGAVLGSLVLVGGAPGIGKSTLLLQMCAEIARKASGSSSFAPIAFMFPEVSSTFWLRRISMRSWARSVNSSPRS